MVKEKKLRGVESLKEDLEKADVIAFIEMHKMPSKQLQEIRKMLRGKAKIKMMKKSTLRFAIEGTKKDKIKKLEAYIPRQPAIAFTELGAFKFYSLVEGLRFKTFAKGGDVATEDVWVSAGPTNLMAGPVISELQQAGVAASIEGGRIKIRKDVCLVKEGDEIPAVKANVLRKLKIEPMEVSLKVVAVYDNGDIYTKEVLDLTKTFPSMIVSAFNSALNLSVYICFPTKENIKQLIAKAARAANAIKDLMGGVETEEAAAEAVGGVGKATEPAPEEPQKEDKVEEDSSDDIIQETNEEVGGAS